MEFAFGRMSQFASLWLPGTDHAGIATQAVVERKLKKEKKQRRQDLGREKFLDEVWEWKETYGDLIVNQLKALGVSCDWRRSIFTMDTLPSEAVVNTFIALFEAGLIYKGKRIINWCPETGTALSDEEVIMKTQTDKLVYVKYLLAENPKEFIPVATVRPETILADVAVAVNPNDDRYSRFIGKDVIVPLCGKMVPIIADECIEIGFGTGALKVTPAHDATDYAIAVRHHLPLISVIGKDGKMTDEYGFNGLDRFEARKQIIEKLTEAELLVKIEEYEHNVGYSERADVVVEPMLSEQWFVKMEPLAKPALNAVENGEITFHPDYWVSTYRHWMTTINDWCISRQLWWGHRIPVFYTNASKKDFVVARNKEEALTKFAENGIAISFEELIQEEDVLDTWFSSWLWPLTTLGWTQKGSETDDLKTFYPTDTLVTGPDIIFFWVARMIMAGLYFTKQIPFKNVYFTSIIRDTKGRKLSKSLGNSPNPLDVIATYGTDAMRFTVVFLAPLGHDIRFSKEQCEHGRNFATKIWNAARFLFMNRNILFQDLNQFAQNYRNVALESTFAKTLDEQWIVSRLATASYSYHEACRTLKVNEMARVPYHFLWDDFCDWFIECLKFRFQENVNIDVKQTSLLLAIRIFEESLKMLHPVMPFITEEIWQTIHFGRKNESISKQTFLSLTQEKNETTEMEMEFVIKIVSEIRATRASLGVTPTIVATIQCSTKNEHEKKLTEKNRYIIEKLTRTHIHIDKKNVLKPARSITLLISSETEMYLQLEGLIDFEKERNRLTKEISTLENYVLSLKAKLSQAGFTERAPAHVVKEEKHKLSEAEHKLAKHRINLRELE
ncbi:hypothetical protein CHS0354_023956 [Potamilus streckersoni]|uniref:valine--tRNA ligase n=1 Tax=Potamilus streckersoni TaxID=2493646 RepID=A0AAE0RZK3_9BIVA|nr:hypothetical protein CHS0354_023956 [Potamilus streckersoni]